jgi:hypothetical protein
LWWCLVPVWEPEQAVVPVSLFRWYGRIEGRYMLMNFANRGHSYPVLLLCLLWLRLVPLALAVWCRPLCSAVTCTPKRVCYIDSI